MQHRLALRVQPWGLGLAPGSSDWNPASKWGRFTRKEHLQGWSLGPLHLYQKAGHQKGRWDLFVLTNEAKGIWDADEQ